MTYFALLGVAHFLGGQAAQPPLDPDLAYMGKLVGDWDAVAHAGKEAFKCHFTFAWNPDHRGLHSESIIAMDSKQPMHSTSMFGYDPVVKAAYYVDAHDSDTLYTGHVYLENNKLV